MEKVDVTFNFPDQINEYLDCKNGSAYRVLAAGFFQFMQKYEAKDDSQKEMQTAFLAEFIKRNESLFSKQNSK